LTIAKKNEIKKIVIIGPESTGKSTLCKQLALHYNTNWCPEFAREYLLKNGMNYTYRDLLKIAKGQLAMEDEYVQSAVFNQQLSVSNQPPVEPHFTSTTNDSPLTIHHLPAGRHGSLLFIDTDMYVMKVWCEFVFGKCHQWITEQIETRKYDLYLLCNVDLPWVKDELREYPDLITREKLYHIYKNLLTNQPVPWADISGGYEERLEKAISTTDKLFKK
jgi:nicotinamide riboside kinase